MQLQTKQPEFVVIIPSYNNQKYYKANIDSVLQQEYPNFEIIIIEDCWSECSGYVIDEYIKEHAGNRKVTVIHNKVRQGALYNWYKAIHRVPDHKIIVQLDGDDELPPWQVLSYLAQIYSDRNIWMTYGQFMFMPHYKKGTSQAFPAHVIKNNSFRDYTGDWIASHLRTFYAGLFKKIAVTDLLFDGDFYQVAADVALLLPILEMASQDHIKFIDETLYFYNETNPLNDSRTKNSLVLKMDRHIRARKRYSPLEKLDCISYYN